MRGLIVVRRRLGVRCGAAQDLLEAVLEALEASDEFEEALAEFLQGGVVLVGAAVGEELGFFELVDLLLFHGSLHESTGRAHRDRPGSDTLRTMHRIAAFVGAVILGSAGGAARAEPGERLSLFSAPSSAFADQPESDERMGETAFAVYGTSGTEHLTVLSIFAPNLRGEFDAGLSLQYTTFLIDGFEVGAEGTFWGFFQDDDTVGVSAGLVMRYHFYRSERWSIFADAGMGAAVSGDDVPDGGTSFNLMPRLGAGVTWRMFEDSPTRLVTGLRWHHLSNARVKGEEDNPARDAPGLYVGVTFEF